MFRFDGSSPDILGGSMYLSAARQAIAVVFTVVLTLVVSERFLGNEQAFRGTLNETTLAGNFNLAFAVSLILLVAAGIGLGLMITLQTFSAAVIGSVFYGLGLISFMAMDVRVLHYTWPITGLIALSVLAVLLRKSRQDDYDDEECFQPLLALPNRNFDEKTLRRPAEH